MLQRDVRGVGIPLCLAQLRRGQGDNLGAATHKLKDSKGRDFNERYKEILDHYGLKATRTNSYSAHENGVAEQGHRRKDVIAQE